MERFFIVASDGKAGFSVEKIPEMNDYAGFVNLWYTCFVTIGDKDFNGNQDFLVYDEAGRLLFRCDI